MSFKPSQERRKSRRKSFEDTTWVFSLFLQEKDIPTSPLRLEAQNISLGGIKFLSNRKIPLFDVIYTHLFEKKNKGEPLKLSAKVVRVEEIDTGKTEKTYGIAAQFEEVSEKSLALLKKNL